MTYNILDPWSIKTMGNIFSHEEIQKIFFLTLLPEQESNCQKVDKKYKN